MSHTFDTYAFADYSGATSPQQQRKHIVLATLQRGAVRVSDAYRDPVRTESHTRESLLQAVQDLLLDATERGERVMVGFDHNYSFPVGFYETVTGSAWERWEQLLDLLTMGTAELPPVAGEPRLWAERANALLATRCGVETGGPFWGSHFSQLRDPKFPFAQTRLQEKRLVEQRCKRMKPLYKIGGAGAVGLQSLYGIGYLAKLRSFCKQMGIPLHAWPFDGWELPASGHVLVEVYPTLYNHGMRTDAEDARACAFWMEEQDRTEQWGKWFAPTMSEEERRRASLEGWVLGVL